MYGYIYLTTNLINNKKYIGQHKAQKFSQRYVGSGSLIKKSIKKYGRDAFQVQLLCECESQQELNEKELYYIQLYNAVEDPNFYNIERGGSFYDSSYQQRMSQSAKNRVNKGVGMRCVHKGNIYTRVKQEKVQEYLLDGWSLGGRPHSQESKQNHIKAKQGLLVYTNGEQTIYIKEDDIEAYQNKGFYPGRVPSIKKGTTRYAWVNNGEQQLYIKFEYIDQYLSIGYKRGMLKGNRPYNRKKDTQAHNKGKIQVRKDGRIKHIDVSCLQQYIDDGYEKVKKD